MEETWAIDPAGPGMIRWLEKAHRLASKSRAEEGERFPGGISLFQVATADRPQKNDVVQAGPCYATKKS